MVNYNFQYLPYLKLNLSTVVYTLIPALGRQKQTDFCEFEVILAYTELVARQPEIHSKILLERSFPIRIT